MHSRIAWLAAATHVVASLAMLLLLRGGLPGTSQAERLAYMHANQAAWVGGWIIWQIAALSLMAFYVVLAVRFRGVLSEVALIAAAAGLAIDIVSESRYMAVLPELRGEAFAALDRELEVLIGYGANGLYTVALVLLVIAGWGQLTWLARLLGVPVAVAGFALAAVSLLHDARLEMLTSATLFPLFTLWIVVLAFWLRKNE
jgi:hypothetical protein